jgi:hypothetical protein
MDRYAHGDHERLKIEQAFRDKLSDQIRELTGVKPRFVFTKVEDKNWIYYYYCTH